MKLSRFITITLILLAVFAQTGYAMKVTDGEPLIRVGLALKQSKVNLSAESALFLLTEDGRIIKNFRPNEPIELINNSGRLMVNGAPVSASSLILSFTSEFQRGHGGYPAALVDYARQINQHGSFIKMNGKNFRGIIRVNQTGTKLDAINILRLEDYLYGVIPKEIPPNWPIEAIKAQAVAARSYAFANSGKHQDQGFEVCTTVHCQVYGGQEAESKHSNQAVDETRGIMATYGGSVITAFFHSSSGGHTESSENVWGSPVPYLRGVGDFDQASPRFSWSRQVSAAEFAGILEKNGTKVGKLRAIELTPFDSQPVTAPDRGLSGRVKTVRIIGDAGSTQLSGAKFSSLLNLPSSLFDLTIGNSVQPVFSATAKKTLRRAIYDGKDVLIITGRGAGHGIGLSQWGAKAMAERFASGRKDYYKEILAHYYKDIKLEKWY